ncbi:C2H2_type zinc-finger domain-containing protein [Hexamita inflata]|uniref:C2H2 type zinc-finger domain-containing protein n=1 Tax=Hexamita inflata TaxID=28002 RepID=A0AA86QAC5_9EUKA|nr:C2H2 type zinc-finger domain-containing protein [Hexamita inflata]CAI9954763.1 C2H2 type zinc-finger domain-containing protein [Hexamita inflata]
MTDLNVVQEIFPCDICKQEFVSRNDHQVHCETNFHIQNRSRRREGLPPLSLKDYYVQITTAHQDLYQKEETNIKVHVEPEFKFTQFNCIFCKLSFPNLLEHMREHGFFIPYADYCVKVDKYIEFCQYRTFTLRQCLQCKQYFDTLDQLQRHFYRKNHLHFDYDVDDFSQFYDFRKSYPKEARNEEFAKFVPFVLYSKEYMDKLKAEGKIRIGKEIVVPKFLIEETERRRQAELQRNAQRFQQYEIFDRQLMGEVQKDEALTDGQSTMKCSKMQICVIIGAMVAVWSIMWVAEKILK